MADRRGDSSRSAPGAEKKPAAAQGRRGAAWAPVPLPQAPLFLCVRECHSSCASESGVERVNFYTHTCKKVWCGRHTWAWSCGHTCARTWFPDFAVSVRCGFTQKHCSTRFRFALAPQRPWALGCTRGRCVNGSACTQPHTKDPATILCNSMVSAADKGVSASNKSYGYCALRMKNLPCPYKDCIHTLTIASPESEQKAESEGEPATVQMEE